ncbi:hypothetical protein, partial [Vreelandella boliviensis]|uniref:hypothetical protein n=1 Tax=Vreelandella boliviensis TaxID=223527 RepID=UPI001C3D3356
ASQAPRNDSWGVSSRAKRGDLGFVPLPLVKIASSQAPRNDIGDVIDILPRHCERSEAISGLIATAA